jgi:hypothetical protein
LASGRALPATCAAAALVCSWGRGGTKRAGGGGGVPGVGATTRVWRIRRCPDGGDGRWDRVGRGRSGSGGRVHRRNYVGGHAEAGIW